MNPDVLQEEFSNELGDVNAFKLIDVIENNKKRTKRRTDSSGIKIKTADQTRKVQIGNDLHLQRVAKPSHSLSGLRVGAHEF